MAAVTDGTAVVVGGASGIGAACATRLVEDGWAVRVADRQAPADDVAIPWATADVRDASALQDTIQELLDGAPLDGLVYAAGTGRVAPLGEITPEQWQLVVEVNLNGAFHAVRAALPHMRPGAAIVLISSIDSAAPVSGLAHYCASKAGLEALSRSIALELGPRGIRCNVVAPGPVRTPLMADVYRRPGAEATFTSRTPLGALAEPSQVADVVVYLLSPTASHVTGARLPVDGGMSLREHPSMLTLTERTP
jgi:3-oxoacyl-[acyl-carrier protein] reductase